MNFPIVPMARRHHHTGVRGALAQDLPLRALHYSLFPIQCMQHAINVKAHVMSAAHPPNLSSHRDLNRTPYYKFRPAPSALPHPSHAR